jgi:hypothetical protein
MGEVPTDGQMRTKPLSERTELRKGYHAVTDWVDEGMKPKASIAFTEGDCRLAAELIEYAMRKVKK